MRIQKKPSGGRGQASDQGESKGLTKFYHFKTYTLENRGGNESGSLVPLPSGLANEEQSDSD